MIVETKRMPFDPIKFPLADLVAETIEGGEVLDFDFDNQFKETHEALEVFVSASATAGETVTPAVAKEVTLEVTVAPTSNGDITVDGVTIAVTTAAQTSLETTALAIASATYDGWTAVQGTDADVAKVFFTASVAGLMDDIVFDGGTTGVTATVETTEEGVAEITTQHAPTLQLLVKTGDAADSLTTVLTSKTFTLAEIAENEDLWKIELPETCGKFIQISVNVASTDVFTGGEIVGVIRPL